MCECHSYNCPEIGGNVSEVLLDAPSWAYRSDGGKQDKICIDACIADTIKHLWDNGIVTLGCCCGHNRDMPSVIVSENENPEKVLKIINQIDKRKWKVLQWKLVEFKDDD